MSFACRSQKKNRPLLFFPRQPPAFAGNAFPLPSKSYLRSSRAAPAGERCRRGPLKRREEGGKKRRPRGRCQTRPLKRPADGTRHSTIQVTQARLLAKRTVVRAPFKGARLSRAPKASFFSALSKPFKGSASAPL